MTKMNKFLGKLAGSVLAAMLIVGLLVAPAGAASRYTPIAGTSTTFNKYLVIPAGTNTPAASFSYSIRSGSARAAAAGEMAVYAGLNPELITISDSVFTSNQATKSAATTETDVVRNDRSNVKFETTKGELFATSTSTINFSAVTFPEPGIYRYIITENISDAHVSQGIVHDDDNDRVLDVYVVDADNMTLRVAAYVMHRNDQAVVAGTDLGSADVNANGATLADKTDGFTNEYKPKDLTFSKTVRGNQGSRDKYFAFTLKFSNLTAGDTFNVSLSNDGNANTKDGNADSVTASNAATVAANTGKTNVTSLTANAQGKVEQVFYLQHGQSIAVLGLPLNASYTLTEDYEDYKSSRSNGYTGVMAEDVNAPFTNTRGGVIPTGIVLTVVPGVIVAAAGAAGIIVMKSRKRNEEE